MDEFRNGKEWRKDLYDTPLAEREAQKAEWRVLHVPEGKTIHLAS